MSAKKPTRCAAPQTSTSKIIKRMKKIRWVFFVAVFGLLSGNSFAQGQAAGIQFFQGTFAEALAKAKAEDKLVFMDAYAEWCGPCKWMAANTFTNAQVGEYFNANFVNVKMDMEKGEGPALAREYGVRAYPTLFFINPDTRGVVHTQMGGQAPADFLRTGQTASSKAR